jgi:acetoacetate decarboxylase
MEPSLERPQSADIIQGGFSTPCDSPLRPQFPNGDASAFLRFYDVEIFSVTWETAPGAIDRVVPEPLARREGTNDHVIAHLISYPDSEWFGAFTEAIFTVGCVTTDPDGTPEFVPQEGAFVPYCFTSSEAKLSLGREVYGLPYKFAETRIEKKGDLLVGSVERNGTTILRATMPHKQAVTTPRGFDDFFEWRRLVALRRSTRRTVHRPSGS